VTFVSLVVALACSRSACAAVDVTRTNEPVDARSSNTLEAVVADALAASDLASAGAARTAEESDMSDKSDKSDKSDVSDYILYKITAEALVQTGGHRQYFYRDFKYRVGLGEATNVPPLIPFRRVNILPGLVEVPTNVPGPLLNVFDFPTPPPIKPPLAPPPEPEKAVVVYIDTVELGGIGMPDENAPLLSDQFGVSDPLEGFNRVMFVVDGAIFVYFLEPVGKGYRYVVPRYARQGFKRMDYNIQMPKRLLNNLFQAKFKGAGITFTRFLVNTTVGVIGFYDPAGEWFGMEKYAEDTGQTFGKWGIGPGCYLYIPIMGSASVRDGVGMIIDDQLDPRAWIPFGGSGIRFVMKFNNMSLMLDALERLREENLDPYTFRRDMWYLIRTAEIAD